MPDWLYRTTSTQSATTDASGTPFTKDVWEARVLGGAFVYQSAKLVPDTPAPTQPNPAPTLPQKKLLTLADKISHESHWLDVDRTADSRAQSPDLPEPKGEKVKPALSVGVLGFNVYGSGGNDKPQVRDESHWLDVDRIADSRAESPVLGEPASPGRERKETAGSPLKNTQSEREEDVGV